MGIMKQHLHPATSGLVTVDVWDIFNNRLCKEELC